MKNKNIHICFCINDEYVRHTLSTISSIIENSSLTYDLRFYIISDYISKENKNKIELLNKQKKYFNIQIIEIDEKYNPEIDLWKYGQYILYRLSIPEIISAEKIIYLDSDMIVLWNIEELWEVDLGNNILGIVEQEKPKNFPWDTKYFNSWLLVINSQLWKDNNIKGKVLDFLKNEKHYWWPDQDALNIVIQKNHLFLDASWNVLHFNVKNKVNIFHFAWLKPWRFISLNPYNMSYYESLKKIETLNQREKVLYTWNKFLVFIPLSVKSFIHNTCYTKLYYFKEYILNHK